MLLKGVNILATKIYPLLLIKGSVHAYQSYPALVVIEDFRERERIRKKVSQSHNASRVMRKLRRRKRQVAAAGMLIALAPPVTPPALPLSVGEKNKENVHHL